MHISMAIPSLGATFSERSRGMALNGDAFAVTWRARTPSDPLGTFTLSITNVVVGSRYRIEAPGGALAEPSAGAEGVAGTTDISVTLNYYESSNPKNTLKIKVRNASGSPSYRPYETQTTAGAGSRSVFIAQELDE